MLKMIRGKDTLIIDKVKGNYRVTVTLRNIHNPPIHYTNIYNCKLYGLDYIIEIGEEDGYIPFETSEEWKYKYDRM